MLSKKKDTTQSSMFFGLEDMLNQKHPMYILANKVNWQLFEDSFSSLYCLDNGRPAKPIRLMVGLLILKHLRNISRPVLPNMFFNYKKFRIVTGSEGFRNQFLYSLDL